MQYETVDLSATFTAKLAGRVTYADHPAFRDIVTRIRASHAPSVVLDLAAVEFIDSAGLGMLLMARDAAAERKAEVAIAGAQGQVRRVILSSKFDKMFQLRD